MRRYQTFPSTLITRYRWGVLVIGVLGCIVNIAGLVAYAIFQVPTIRDYVSRVFILTMDVSLLDSGEVTDTYRLTQLLYMYERVETRI